MAARLGGSAARRTGRKTLRRCLTVVDEVAMLEPRMKAKSDAALESLTAEFRARVEAGEEAFGLIYEAFAAVREAARRTLGLRLYDEQVMGGAAMAMGTLAQMRESEGKTLACVLPAYLAALDDAPVHVMAADDQEAEKAERWMAPVYRALGARTALLRPGAGQEERAAAYAADVVYGAFSQFGFDRVRDEMASEPEEVVQPDLGTAVMDDALVPLVMGHDVDLVISGPLPEKEAEQRARWARMAEALSADAGDYSYDPSTRAVRLLEPGAAKLRELLETGDLRAPENAIPLALVAGALTHAEAGGDAAPGLAAATRCGVIHTAQLLHEYETLTGVAADLEGAAEAVWREYGLAVTPIPPRRPARAGGGRIVVDPERFERQVAVRTHLDAHRAEWAGERDTIVSGGDGVVEGVIGEFFEWALSDLPRTCERGDLEALFARLDGAYPGSVTVEDLLEAPRRDAVAARLRDDFDEAYRRRRAELGADVMAALEREVLLRVKDREWRGHLDREYAFRTSLPLLGAVDDGGPEGAAFADAYEKAMAESYSQARARVVQDCIGFIFHLEIEESDIGEAGA